MLAGSGQAGSSDWTPVVWKLVSWVPSLLCEQFSPDHCAGIPLCWGPSSRAFVGLSPVEFLALGDGFGLLEKEFGEKFPEYKLHGKTAHGLSHFLCKEFIGLPLQIYFRTKPGVFLLCQFHLLHLHQLFCLKDNVLMATLNRLICCFTKKVSQANYRKLPAARSPVIRVSVKNATTGTQLRTALQSGFAFLLDRLHPHPRPFTQLCFFPQWTGTPAASRILSGQLRAACPTAARTLQPMCLRRCSGPCGGCTQRWPTSARTQWYLVLTLNFIILFY